MTRTRPLRALVVAAIASVLGLTLAVVPPTLAPDQAAHALCLSSIDPKCNPGVLPILSQLNIVRAGAGSVPVPGQAAIGQITQGVSQMTLNTAGAAAAGIVGVFTWPWGADDADGSMPKNGKIDGALASDGVRGLAFDVDVDWQAAAPPGSHRNGDCFMRVAYYSPTVACDWSIAPGIYEAFFRANSFSTTTVGSVLVDVSAGPNVTLTLQRTSSAAQIFYLRPLCDVGGGTLVHASQWFERSASGALFETVTVSGSQGVTWCAQTSGAPAFYGWEIHSSFGSLLTTSPSAGIATVWTVTGGGYSMDEFTGTIDVEVTCVSPSGTYTVTGQAQVSAKAGRSIVAPDVVCNSGDIASGAGVTLTKPGEAPVTLIDAGVNVVPEIITDLPAEYPLCFGTGAQLCPLLLQQLDGVTWTTCGEGGVFCPNWAATPEPALTDSYRCLFGPYTVDIRFCSAFRAPASGLLPNVDPDTGELLHPSAPVPTLLPGTPLYDPAGNPWPTTTPVPPIGPGGAGSSTHHEAMQCWPEGWGVLNPFEWVFRPIQCALHTAFVPRTEVVTAQSMAMQASWASTPPAVIAAFIDDLAQDSPTLDGCSGPRFYFSVTLLGNTITYDDYPMSACEEPASTLAGLSRLISALAIYWSGVVAISRYFGATLTFPQFGSAS